MAAPNSRAAGELLRRRVVLLWSSGLGSQGESKLLSQDLAHIPISGWVKLLDRRTGLP